MEDFNSSSTTSSNYIWYQACTLYIQMDTWNYYVHVDTQWHALDSTRDLANFQPSTTPRKEKKNTIKI